MLNHMGTHVHIHTKGAGEEWGYATKIKKTPQLNQPKRKKRIKEIVNIYN